MKITATINDVAFSKESRGGFWMILLTDKGTFKGAMVLKPKSNSEWEFNGEWTVYNGQKEFKFIGSMPVIPVDPYALLCYCCNMAKGVGPKLREAIWEKWKQNWELEFCETKGVTEAKSREILNALNEAKLNEVQVKVISFLMTHECSENLAYKAWNEWKADTIPKVEENCFCLTELFMVGFGHIDGKIREAFKMDFIDTRRIKSGVLYSYNQCASSGSTAIPAEEFIAECEKNLRINTEYISKALQIMLESQKFKLFTKGGIQYFSSWENYTYELVVHELIKENSKNEKPRFW